MPFEGAYQVESPMICGTDSHLDPAVVIKDEGNRK